MHTRVSRTPTEAGGPRPGLGAEAARGRLARAAADASSSASPLARRAVLENRAGAGGGGSGAAFDPQEFRQQRRQQEQGFGSQGEFVRFGEFVEMRDC